MSGIDRISERWANTTPGPWTARWVESTKDWHLHSALHPIGDVGGLENAEAISHAPHDIRLLLNVARAADDVSACRLVTADTALLENALETLEVALHELDQEAG